MTKRSHSDTHSHTRGKDKSSSNLKLINTSNGIRVSQACDRCRIKKIKCDGQLPCVNCKKIGFECKTSDKLTRRAFPKGYTENLELKLKELERINKDLQDKLQDLGHTKEADTSMGPRTSSTTSISSTPANPSIPTTTTTKDKVIFQSSNQSVQINNPIDQIFNLDNKGIIIGNDNLNFESQFNHLLIDLNLPFLKITNTHNYLLNDPNSYLYNPSYTKSNQLHNKDLDIIYNPLTADDHSNNTSHATPELSPAPAGQKLPVDVYDLFIKLINNFKNLFSSKKEMDNQVIQFFLNYNIFIPIFDYKQFMLSYEAFHNMYPFMFTYDDATINGFYLSNSSDYNLVNQYLLTIIQIYAMIMINDPTINLNLLLNHPNPQYNPPYESKPNASIIKSIYDFLPYMNGFHISINQLQTYLLFLYYSLLTNNKEKSLILSALVNAFIGVLGINLNSKNLFFNDLSLNQQQRRTRVQIFWVFKILLKCFNLKFGFKPSLNTTVINPVTIDRYFQLTPEKLSSLLDDNDDLFNNLLKPSIEFLNLMNIVIPSSFSPNYYQYLRQNKKKREHHSSHRLDWILNEDDGDGNDGNLNYNYNQFLTIDKNLANWRQSLKTKKLRLVPLHMEMGLPNYLNITENDLYHDIKSQTSGITPTGLVNYETTGTPDIHTASQLIKIQLNFHYILIRSMNYLNFIVDKELNFNNYQEIAEISQEVLSYFLLIFGHLDKSVEKLAEPIKPSNSVVMQSLGLDVDEHGFVINDFAKKRKKNKKAAKSKRYVKQIPKSPFNIMLNGLSMTVINLKKSIVLQMIYLLICQLKFNKPTENSIELLNRSVDLFMHVFINYKPGLENSERKLREDILFRKLMNDEFKDEILNNQDDDDEDDDEEPDSYKSIDWDDEELDEDLKYLKILKYVKYKSNDILHHSKIPTPDQVHFHHHIHSTSPPPAPPKLPLPNPSASFYGQPSSYSLNKVPSLSKFDMQLDSDIRQDQDLSNKERGVINDLIRLSRTPTTSPNKLLSPIQPTQPSSMQSSNLHPLPPPSLLLDKKGNWGQRHPN
ncbi:uncharacterized protein SPAPADRAFT_154694 [Spathaspora passalidarum NRRL Y-27907]|uniref:Zn(2)-C6 fungal-type domain-containing protein n=1 Tax=Spathaspora passalidarum (strain NRRL Y-27907 / 11-Y1) TaxID=619300 RepID=G3AQD4_SPAPN|nr:uncharacterized protein SPAPADRAFT_154694 [Spathaspora passalidarum NRRL Y-27907]EGW31481.1 hypothetical protein SPAPADRAFT_154694 [Spathaspora passalidarum NRRL Y-27907]